MSAYDPAQMRADCAEVGRNLRLERAARKAASEPSPSLHFEDFPRDLPKREIKISDAAARLAGALHLHLD
ncbi:hypothetical protein [Nocardioides sp.]|uniref:hypothetical protein n=1 Tax=Nocardioides sp. TaxID=35761 RepID=UPI002ED16C24